jgi:Zn-dependent peptidase ImmA (M78 family)
MTGQHLRTARAAVGLSLRQLEERIGKRVTAQMIGKYERDEAAPPDDVLDVLARALGTNAHDLKEGPELALTGIEFRKRAATTVREQSQLKGKVLQHLSGYLAVEAALGLSSVVWDKPRGAPYPIRDVADAEHAARSVREHWSLGIDPIPSLAELLEERGIKVLSIELTDIAGMAAEVRRSRGAAIPIVVISKNDWSERKRFTLAHEVAHMVMDVTSLTDEKTVERAAHRFAGAFMMPTEVLWNEIGRSRSSISIGELVQLKKLLGVSLQALAYRCRDLGLINEHTFRQLYQEFSRRRWRSPPYLEPGAIDPGREEPRRFERLVFRALAETVITAERATELLHISVDELQRRMNHPPVGSAYDR